MAAGAPTKYKKHFNGKAYNLCLHGATDKGLAIVFKVSRDTIYEWKKVHPGFARSINRAKLITSGWRKRGYSISDTEKAYLYK
jgi:hypothetical protein